MEADLHFFEGKCLQLPNVTVGRLPKTSSRKQSPFRPEGIPMHHCTRRSRAARPLACAVAFWLAMLQTVGPGAPPAAAQGGPPAYTVQVAGGSLLPNSPFNLAPAINANGKTANGDLITGGAFHAWRFDPDAPANNRDLGTLGGPNSNGLG